MRAIDTYSKRIRMEGNEAQAGLEVVGEELSPVAIAADEPGH